MPIKENNEITVAVNSTKDDLINLLISNNFKLTRASYLEDYYYIPSSINLKTNSVRDILSYSIIIRNLYTDITKTNCVGKRLCHKIKQINDNGDIVNQTQYNLEYTNFDDAKKFLESLNYYEIININENEYLYTKDDITLEIKEVLNGNLLIEVETNEKFDTIEKITNYLHKLHLPIDTSDLFVKKAEIELTKFLNK